MEKVKVSKEVFDCLEAFKRDGNGDLLSELEYTSIKFIGNRWEHYEGFNSIDFKTFLDCAYYGYELEESIEDYIINMKRKHPGSDPYDTGFRIALILISKKLGIDIN